MDTIANILRGLLLILPYFLGVLGGAAFILWVNHQHQDINAKALKESHERT